MANNWKLINTDTGETKELAEHQQARTNQRKGYAKVKEGRNHDFTFTNMDSIARVIEAIEDKHCGYLLYLQCFIAYEDGVLTNPNRDKTPMTKNEIMGTLGLKKTAFYDFYRNMVGKGIIIENDDKTFSVNEDYHFKGSTTNTATIKSFTAKVRDLYTAKDAKKLGFIYKLLPYVHFDTNTICNNPYERDMAQVKQLSKNDIAEITGVTEKTVYSYLRKTKLGEQFIFAEVRSGNTHYYKLNPFIFYRKKGRPDASLREMFLVGFSGK